MGMSKKTTYNENALLQQYEGTVQHCSGTVLTAAMIGMDEGDMHMSAYSVIFKDVYVGDVHISHKWMLYTKQWSTVDLTYGCRVEFDALIIPYEKYTAKYS